MTFNQQTSLLAFVTTTPEYMMCIYDIKGKLELKGKAYSNTVLKIKFTEYT